MSLIDDLIVKDDATLLLLFIHEVAISLVVITYAAITFDLAVHLAWAGAIKESIFADVTVV